MKRRALVRFFLKFKPKHTETMLILNNEILNVNAREGEKHHKAAKHYRDRTRQIIKEHGEYVRFIRPNVHKINESGLVEPIPPRTLGFVCSRVNEHNEPEIWLYSKSLPKRKDGVYTLAEKERKGMAVYAALTVSTERDMDLLYFIMELSHMYKVGRLIIDDPQAEAKKRVDAKKRVQKLQEVLYSDLSPLANEDTLKDVASAWGIANVDKLSAPQIVMALEAELQSRDKIKKVDKKTKGSEEFLQSLGNIDEEVRKRALIRRAEDSGIVKYDSEHFYYILEESGEQLVYIPPTSIKNRFEYFADQVLKPFNEKMWEKVKRVTINAEYIDGLKKMDDIRWLCREHGINQKQKSLETLKTEIKEVYC